MEHNQISALCRSVVATKLGILEDEIPLIPWDHMIYDFAVEHAGRTDLNEQQIRVLFQDKVDQWLTQQQELKEFYDLAIQRHHDYYVRLKRQGELSWEDEENYNLAMQREQVGLVQPLPEE